MQRPFIISGLIGLTVVAMSLVLMVVNPRQAAGLPDGFFTPIIALEFAETAQDITLIFGENGTAEQSALAGAFDLGSRLDFIYMLLYSAFLFTFALTTVKLTGSKLYYGVAVLAIVALLADALENQQLLQITASLGSGDFAATLSRLKLFTWLKWGSLAFAFLLLTSFFGQNAGLGRFLAMGTAVPFVLGLFAYFAPGLLNELFALSVALTFLLMIVFCFVYRGQVEK